MESLTLYLDPAGDLPLYRQLYDALAEEIRSGRLAAGEKLPSKRRLSADLRVSVNTVDAAYQMLTAEGYLRSRPRSGFEVCRLERLELPRRPGTASEPRPVPAEETEVWRFDLGTGGIDTGLFPFKTWRRIQRDVLAGNPDLLRHGHRQGDVELRRAIAKYLHEYRGALCAPEQIVVGAGMEYLLGLVARMFPGETFAVEDPGYDRTYRILENNGARVAFLPVDGEGLSAAALEASPAKLAYVTPSHQFPTGATMPAGRRTELLRWAAGAPGRYLIEDDYDSEFRFDGKPLPCLQGLDGGRRVIMIGTFSRSVAPAIRIAYMVLPEELLEKYREEFGFYACTVSRFEQQTLRRFLEEGHFARHLARSRNAYRQRRDALTDALRRELGPENLAIRGSHTGLHLLLEVRCGLSQEELVRRAREAGIKLRGLAEYRHEPGGEDGPVLVLGYGGLAPDQVDATAAALAEAWRVRS